MIHTGLRPAEMRRLRWGDIQFGNNLVWVEPSKGQPSRSVALPAAVKVPLLCWLQDQRDLAQSNPRIAALLDDPRTAWVFLGREVADSLIAHRARLRYDRRQLWLWRLDDGQRPK